MSPTDLSTRPARAGSRAPLIALVVVGAIVALALLRLAAVAMDTPDAVDRVTIVNETDFGVDVDLRSAPDGARLLLGRALPAADTTRREVLDAGDVWIFSFLRAGVDAGEVRLTRDQLAAADWRVTVPDDVVATIEESGQNPYPDEGSR
jgi:hypothetical protein